MNFKCRLGLIYNDFYIYYNIFFYRLLIKMQAFDSLLFLDILLSKLHFFYIFFLNYNLCRIK